MFIFINNCVTFKILSFVTTIFATQPSSARFPYRFEYFLLL
jgi:hypothetical protein